ncbi:MAG TPA: helix-turn-helix transcriptional regulator [Emticicia sp.]
MTTHHGKRLTEIAKSKGINATELGKIVDRSRQTVEYHMNREFIKSDILAAYAKALNVNVQEFMREYTEEKHSKISNDDYLGKYLKAVEKIDFLQSILLKNGIKVDMPNFNWGVSVSGFGRINKHIFFDKRIQKRTHPMQNV